MGDAEIVKELRHRPVMVNVAHEAAGHSHVLADREVVEEVAGLEQHADRASPQPGSHFLASARKSNTVDTDRPAIGFVETGEARKQGRLPGPGRSGHGNELARVDGNRDAPKGQSLVVTGVVEAVEIRRFERDGHIVHVNESVTRFHGSTLSEPVGAERVTVTAVPFRQNS